MTEAAGSSFTDLLVNQPILVWSLAGGVSILVIAGFLSLFLSVRSRAQKKQAQNDAIDEARLAEAKRVQTAVSELQTLAEEETDDDDDDQTAVSAAQAPIERVTLGGEGEEGAESATFVETATAGTSGPAAVVEENPNGIGDQGDENGLAALFSADVIVDPHLQSLRDNLPEVSIEELLTNIRSVTTQLQERIDAASAAAQR